MKSKKKLSFGRRHLWKSSCLFNSEERATNTHTNRAINAHRAVAAAAVCRREKVLSSSTMDVFFRHIGSEKKKTIWIETRWNEEEIIDTDASKKDNQRIRLGGKCNLPTLSRKKKRRGMMGSSITDIYKYRPDAAAAGVNSGRERERQPSGECASLNSPTRNVEIKRNWARSRHAVMCRVLMCASSLVATIVPRFIVCQVF